MISLKATFKDDAEEVKFALLLFSSPGKQDAEIVSTGTQKRLPTGTELAREGAKTALAHAEAVYPRWGDMAYAALKEFISITDQTFLAEDVRNWARSVPPAPSLRSWGAVMLHAAKVGLIKQVGYAKVSNPTAHSANAAVWASA